MYTLSCILCSIDRQKATCTSYETERKLSFRGIVYSIIHFSLTFDHNELEKPNVFKSLLCTHTHTVSSWYAGCVCVYTNKYISIVSPAVGSPQIFAFAHASSTHPFSLPRTQPHVSAFRRFMLDTFLWNYMGYSTVNSS